MAGPTGGVAGVGTSLLLCPLAATFRGRAVHLGLSGQTQMG